MSEGQTARKGPIGSTNNQQGEKHSPLIEVSLYLIKMNDYSFIIGGV
ncbi:hypothetical protein [Cytobacillus firmus]|nr:hypothetical protein [Cytobacillus firmus]